VDDPSSEEEDVDESLTVPTRPTGADEVQSCDSFEGGVSGLNFVQDDELIDFVDELGRSKPMRRSKVPRFLGVRPCQRFTIDASD